MTEECFLICPIGDPGTDIRRRSDQWVRHVVAPVAQEFGYSIVRADHMPNSGVITNQVIRALIDAPLVIAELTGGNPNVFYELALRHASKKPFIQMIHAGERIPFDLQAVRTIEYDLSDPDDLNTAGTTLSRHVKSIRSGHRADSPVSMALQESMFSEDQNAIALFLEKFWQMEDNSEALLQALDQLKEGVSELGQSISSIESDISSIESDVSTIESKVSDSSKPSSYIGEDIARMQRALDVIQSDIEAITRRQGGRA